MSDERYRITKKVTIVGMFINATLAIMKTSIGIIGRSPALFADGIHSFSDLLSDIMVLFAAKVASKGEDDNHPYGHDRIETLATVALSGLLIAVGLMIVYHSVGNLIAGTYVTPDKFTVVAAILSILGNEFIYQYTMKAANNLNSYMLRANALHSRSDMWSSVVVLVGLIGAFIGFAWLDAIAAVVVCYMIMKMGITWGYSAISELIDEGVDEETKKTIIDIIHNTDGVADFHYLRTRKMAGKIMLDVHILVEKNSTASEGHYIAETVRTNVCSNVEDIKDITVHIDVSNHEDEVIALEDFAPSREQITDGIDTYFGNNGLSLDLISKKRMNIYYFESGLTVNMFVNTSDLLIEHVEPLSKLDVSGHIISIKLYSSL